jgi:SH3-like domain-containing protein
MTATKKSLIKHVSYCGLTAFLLFFATPLRAADDADEPAKLPLPRYVSLKSAEVNMRVGPGTRYSINWVYRRADLPVEIIQEFDQWRQISDSEGTTGWVHKQMLQGKRTALVIGKVAVLRRSPDIAANPVLRAQPGVIGKLLSCEEKWCRVQISGRKAWIAKTSIFGVYKKEEF